MADSWGTLPSIVIIKILSFLDPTDRVAAAATCTHWSSALQSPLLWRNVTVKLLPLNDTSAKIDILSQLALDFGKHMDRLELVWKCPKNSFGFMTEVYGVMYLNILMSEGVQLKKLVLLHWDCSYKSINRHKILQALNKFLSVQFELEELSLMNANMRRPEILRLLSSAQNSKLLKHLDLRGAFRGWQSPYPTPKYLLILRSFPNLTKLQVDYRSLCDPVLDTISKTLLFLKHLEVNISPADTSMYRHLAVSNQGWHNIKTNCPKLEVTFVVVNISHYEDISCFLLPNVPLYNFTFFGGNVWDNSRSRNFRSTGNLLINYYTNTLTDVRLNLHNNKELMDDILIEIIKHCKNLKNLQFDGIIQNMEILSSILSMEFESSPRFKTIRLSPQLLNPRNRILLQNMVFEYKKKLSDRHIDFNIDNVFPVFLN